MPGWEKGQSGNPAGRLKGSIGRLSHEARELAKDHGYDPLLKQIKLAEKVEAIIKRNNFEDAIDRLRHYELLAVIYKNTTPYIYPQLKAVEHTGSVDRPVRTPEERRQRIAALLGQVQAMAGAEGIETQQGAEA